MTALLVVIGVFAFVLLLSRKLSIGGALLAGAVLLGLIFRMEIRRLGLSAGRSLVERGTLETAAMLLLILVLSEAMSESGQLERMVASCRRIFPDARMLIVILPALIGFLPMPGGVYFSAPMVETVFRGVAASAERKAFANYWFRHIWEYIFPLYPGVLLVVSLSGVKLREIVRVNAVLTLTALLFGVFAAFAFRAPRFPPGVREEKFGFACLREFLVQCSPILLIIVLSLVLNVYIIYCLLLGLLLVYLLNRVDWFFVGRTLRRGLSPNMILMIAGIFVFKTVLADSGAVEKITVYFRAHSAGLLGILFAVPFLSGLVTGYTAACIGISLPILLPLLGTPRPPELMFIFASGFSGVLLSPVHLCLILTRQYFRINMFRLYRYLIPGTIVIMAAGLLNYYWLTRR